MKNMLKRAAFSALAALGRIYKVKGVSILVYHSVDEEDSLISTPTEIFRKQMEYLKERRITVLSMKELYEGLVGPDPLPEKCVVITFDDGFEGVYRNAFPILKEFGFPATVFVVTGSVGEEMGWARVEGIPAHRLSTWDELREMDQDGIDIQTHGVTHSFMTELSETELAAEVGDSMRAIEEHLNKKVEFLAYPYGYYNPLTIEVLKKSGIKAAVTCDFWKVRKGHDPYTLGRVGTEFVSGKDPEMLMSLFRASISGTATSYIRLREFVPFIVNRHKRSHYTEK